MVDIGGYDMIPSYYYFWNLETNFHDNQIGECTWVAASIYLSYLETFNRSGIIGDNYIVQSYGNGLDLSQYEESPGTWDGISEKQYDSLECFYTWFVDSYSSDFYSYPILPYNPEFLTGYSRQEDLIINYLTDLGYVNDEEYYIPIASSVLNMNWVYDFIIDELRAGRPVIANTPQHSFIVYGYIPNSKKLIVHNGWKNGHTHDVFDVDNTSAFDGIQLAFSLEFREHTHSYLYVDGLNAYCSCGDEVYTYPYYHKHNMALYYNGKVSYFYCTICGYQEDVLI